MPGEPQEDGDERLIARIATGDRAAMDALCGRHLRSMYRFAVGLCGGDAALAEDAVQEALVAIWRHAGTFGGVHPRAWMLTITRNALRQQLRRRGAVAEPEDEGEVSLEAAGFGSPERARSFLGALESRDELRVALGQLSDGERALVLLVDGEGASLEEAAAALEITVAATKSRLHRARLRLMAALTEPS